MYKFVSKQLVSKWSLSFAADFGLPFWVGVAERIKKKKKTGMYFYFATLQEIYDSYYCERMVLGKRLFIFLQFYQGIPLPYAGFNRLKKCKFLKYHPKPFGVKDPTICSATNANHIL